MREDTFRALVDETHARLFRHARRRLNAETASEVVSDTFVTLWRKQLQDPGSEHETRQMHGFLFRVLEGHMRNALRSEQARSRLLSSLQDQVRGGDNRPEGSVIEELVERLNPDERRIISLYTDGFRTFEIAEILGCTDKAAGMRLVRARRALQAVAEEVVADERK